MKFNLQLPLGNGVPLHSDFIYNIDKYDDQMLNLPITQDIAYAPVYRKIKEEAGKNIFVTDEIPGIPKNLIQPSVHISKYEFKANLGTLIKEYMTILNFQSPLNINFKSSYALAKFFNSKNLEEQMKDFLLFFSRIPVYIQFKNIGLVTIVTNLTGLLLGWENTGNAFHFKNYAGNPELKKIVVAFEKWNGGIYEDEEQKHRVAKDTETDNVVYKIAYSEGRFYGVNSPQPVDWYMNTVENPQSSMNNISMLRAILEICMLGGAYNNNGYYTLTNAAIFANYEEKTGTFRFTGKYLSNNQYSPNISLHQDNLLHTSQIIETNYRNFKDNWEISGQITQETGFVFFEWNTKELNNYKNLGSDDKFIHLTYYSVHENNQRGLPSMEAAIQVTQCVTGLEDFYKNNLSIFIAGMYGLYWDKVLKYFDFSKKAEDNSASFSLFEFAYPSFSFVQNYGTPLAIWCKHFKTEAEKNILMGYSLGNLSKLIELGAVSVQDHVAYNTGIIPSKNPSAMYPVNYNNVNYTINITCWRSYKQLLMTAKTRKKRDNLFDYLNTYGKKCMTIMDPYGIFLHFHNETRGLEPSDQKKDGN